MADDTPKTVAMEALADHTFSGKAYKPGDTYQAGAEYVETLTALHFAKVAEPKAAAKPKK